MNVNNTKKLKLLGLSNKRLFDTSTVNSKKYFDIVLKTCFGFGIAGGAFFSHDCLTNPKNFTENASTSDIVTATIFNGCAGFVCGFCFPLLPVMIPISMFAIFLIC